MCVIKPHTRTIVKLWNALGGEERGYRKDIKWKSKEEMERDTGTKDRGQTEDRRQSCNVDERHRGYLWRWDPFHSRRTPLTSPNEKLQYNLRKLHLNKYASKYIWLIQNKLTQLSKNCHEKFAFSACLQKDGLAFIGAIHEQQSSLIRCVNPHKISVFLSFSLTMSPFNRQGV